MFRSGIILSDMKRNAFKTLREWRKSWDLTQAEAARLFGMSQSKYCKVEIGMQPPRPKVGKRMADKTGVPFEVVMHVS